MYVQSYMNIVRVSDRNIYLFPETTQLGSVTPKTTIIQAIPNVVLSSEADSRSSTIASSTDIKSPTTPNVNSTVKSSLSKQTESISCTLAAAFTTSSKIISDTVSNYFTTNRSTHLVTARNIAPDFFADKGRIAALIAAGSVGIIGGTGIIISTMVATRKPATILPTVVRYIIVILISTSPRANILSFFP